MDSTDNNKSMHRQLLDITLIALFAALCYVLLSVLFIPFANMYIHFGNLVVVLASLLVGGWQGGLAGSIGMGLFDLLNGHADSAPKTFILKLIIGLAVGAVYSLFRKRDRFPTAALLISGTASLITGIAMLIYIMTVNHGFTGKGAVLSPIFLFIGIVCLLFTLLRKRLSVKTAAAIIGSVCGMAVNIAGETLWKYVTFMLAGSSSQAAFVSAAVGQGSTLINAGIAIIGGVALFTLLEKPFGKITGRR